MIDKFVLYLMDNPRRLKLREVRFYSCLIMCIFVSFFVSFIGAFLSLIFGWLVIATIAIIILLIAYFTNYSDNFSLSWTLSRILVSTNHKLEMNLQVNYNPFHSYLYYNKYMTQIKTMLKDASITKYHIEFEHGCNDPKIMPYIRFNSKEDLSLAILYGVQDVFIEPDIKKV